MVAVASPPQRFSGFSDEAIQFFLELQAEQSRAWFKAHQADFVRLWQQPLQAFVAELRPRLAECYPGILEAEPHFFRIQRDTRFARDKTPYKTNVAVSMPIRNSDASDNSAGIHGAPGLYVSFGLDGDYVAAGSWHMPPERLAQYRAALDDPSRGAAVQRIVDDLVAAGWELEAIEKLKRVPPPYPQGHPRAALLKYKGLAASCSPTEGLSSSPALVDWAEAQLRRAAPLVQWLDSVVG